MLRRHESKRALAKSSAKLPIEQDADAATVITDRTQGREREIRVARSAAPSADSRALRPLPGGSISGLSNADGDEAPMLMQVRNVKSSPLDDGLLDGPLMPSRAPFAFGSNRLTTISDKIKELNDTLAEMQSLGIQHVTNLPELVLVGDQSSGKSTLMSSFSGICLPHSEGACTRCPIHIRLSNSPGSSWSCRVSLQQDYRYCPGANISQANLFGPWIEQRREVKEFINLTQPADILEALRWAQRAILNPSKNHDMYKPGTGDIWKRDRVSGPENVNNEAPFSPNTVALEVFAPDLVDLSLYDLPGVFTSARRDEDQYLVRVVENLTAKYISHERSIILWAVPMNADPETSSAFSIIRSQRAQSRTIGIMTKADLLPAGPNACEQWMAMLRGEQHHVGYGYYITACPPVPQDGVPDDAVSQQGLSSRPANDLDNQAGFEEAFFNNRVVGLRWPACFKDFENQCGVLQLSTFMSQQLSLEFAKSLPQIKAMVAAKLEETNRQLECLPDIPENPEEEVRYSLSEFSRGVRTVLEGTSLSFSWTRIVEQFRRETLGLKPRYVVKIDSLAQTRNEIPVIDLADEDAHTQAQPFSSVLPSPSDGRRRHDQFLEGQPDAERGLQNSAKRIRLDQKKAKSLQDIRRIMVAKSKPGMPGLVAEDVYNSLCMEAVSLWKLPLQSLVDSTNGLLENTLVNILQTELGKFRERLLYRKALSALRKFIELRVNSVKERLLLHYNLETHKFFTVDKENLFRHQQSEANEMARHRHHERVKAYLGIDRPPIKNWEHMTDEERSREEARMHQEAARIGPDPFSRELEVCAYVRGYYLTASARFIDTCTLHIMSGLIPDIIESLSKSYLDRELGVFGGTTPQTFIDLMYEDEETANKRNGLKDDQRRFQQTIESIERLNDSGQSVEI